MDTTTIQACSTAVLAAFIHRCDKQLDNPDNRLTPDQRAQVAVFRSIMVGVLDARVAKR